MLGAPRDVVHNQAFNVGRTEENYRVRDIADMVCDVDSRAPRALRGGRRAGSAVLPRETARRLPRVLPEFRPQWTVRRGIEELHEAFERNGLTRRQFDGRPVRPDASHIRKLQDERQARRRIALAMQDGATVAAGHHGARQGESRMKVVLFCGGLGMRIREAGEPARSRWSRSATGPILWHLMKYYAHFGHKDFILCLGYRADAIKTVLPQLQRVHLERFRAV